MSNEEKEEVLDGLYENAWFGDHDEDKYDDCQIIIGDGSINTIHCA